MKRIQYLTTLLALFIFNSLFAQKNLLWKISGNDLNSPSYLFGTIHLIPADKFFLPPGTEEALFSSGKLVLEMDLADPTLQIKLMGAMLMDSGRTLESLYSPAEYRTLSRKLDRKFGIPVEMFGMMKPILLQQSLLIRKMAGGEFKSYEKEFQNMAESRSIPMGGLETLEDQIAALSAMPLEKQAEALLKAVKNPKSSDKALDKMIKLYLSQDIEAMLKGVSGRKSEFSDYEDALLKNRNQKWITPMRRMMAEGSVFFAVGAAHLGGPYGVIALLRNEGYSVEPL